MLPYTPHHYLVVMDRKENSKKCTVAPLASRTDFEFIFYDRGKPIAPLAAAFLLHINGQPLDRIDPSPATPTLGLASKLAVIDCHWKACDKIIRSIAAPLPMLVKIPENFKTAYPRRSKIFDDPTEGLATIEAIFIAAAFLGTWDESLLDFYHWKTDFLALNAETFASYMLPRRLEPLLST